MRSSHTSFSPRGKTQFPASPHRTCTSSWWFLPNLLQWVHVYLGAESRSPDFRQGLTRAQEDKNHFLGPAACTVANAAQGVFGLLHVQCSATENLSHLKHPPSQGKKQTNKSASPKDIKVMEIKLWKFVLWRLLCQSVLPRRADRGRKYPNTTEHTVQHFSQLNPISSQGHNLNKFLISFPILKVQILTDH